MIQYTSSHQGWHCFHLSLDGTKPVFGDSDQIIPKPSCSVAEKSKKIENFASCKLSYNTFLESKNLLICLTLRILMGFPILIVYFKESQVEF